MASYGRGICELRAVSGVCCGMIIRYLMVLAALGVGGCQTSASSEGAKVGRVRVDYAVTSDVVYTPAAWPRALKADVYVPKGVGMFPGVLLVYGGSWSEADHRWQMTLLARRIAARGYVVMSAQYRGTPEARYPAPVDDLREALRWLQAHAGEYKVRVDRLAVYGFSAGGHLAAFLGTTMEGNAPRPRAVVAASAPLDLTLFPTGEILPRFLWATYQERPELYRQASPITHVTAETPPFFLYHGTGDTTVSPEHTRVFKAALDRAGVRNEVRWLEGKGHASVLLFGGEAADEAIDFLDGVLRG